MTKPEPVLLQETLGDVLVLRLNRPDKMNAINNDLTMALIDAFESAAQDKSVRVIGITGQGRGFCSGADFEDTKAGEMFADKMDELESLLSGRYQIEFYGLRPETLLALCVESDLWDAFIQTRK